MDEFRSLWNLAKKDRKYSSWSNKCTLQDRIDEVRGELDEVEEDLENMDYDHFAEEFGDVIWDILAVGAIAEEKGMFRMEEVLKNSVEKFSRRKPWVVKEVRLDLKEDVKRYLENKQNE